jgi:hypothetical protein
MVWKKVFHGVENFGAGEGFGADFFHGVEKSFPQYGKFLGGRGVWSGFFPRCGKKFSTVWKT